MKSRLSVARSNKFFILKAVIQYQPQPYARPMPADNKQLLIFGLPTGVDNYNPRQNDAQIIRGVRCYGNLTSVTRAYRLQRNSAHAKMKNDAPTAYSYII